MAPGLRGEEGPIAQQRPIGPGRLVLVVGPSGAGKDTLLAAVRQRLAGDESFLFPRRIVTRPPSETEDNVEADETMFRRIAEAGGFALTWTAHGHHYGIPAVIDHALYGGRTAVCNVSREVVAVARRRYRNVTVVEITAPADVLLARVAARARSTDGDPTARVERRVAAAVEPDVVIVNDGALQAATERLLAVMTSTLSPIDRL
ncbi:MAG: phosphonate metabolism protein/1,5-bisphosphokinase (PRPP-forming) PhnN [Phreatobacter sp.]|uniref:phosphonate metabolism protein/1,5-bisphosphokinase (PRPP-forming) PhnN n=1 Tax=Phreatobacter sp. TaxID=1966341 RepID=UPI0027325B45|nr:phosphonate metabolism protein/1,5-bisphosphokinase (PRPP-forming) PhnN [Phreatobacter sp.]MDP2800820.1 phosphonate metabolism protein/1,5-bisphosphokinase (PRPP-forming) PhnN [Phreatobacter sp.]